MIRARRGSLFATCLVVAWFVAGSASAQETLTLTFVTARSPAPGTGGVTDFNPRQYAVAWLENDAGHHVRTLGRWGENYWYDLRDWTLGSGFDLDGITGATLLAPGPLTTAAVAIDDLPDGDYQIVIETTEWELPNPGQHNLLRFPFSKNGVAQTVRPVDDGAFSLVAGAYTGRSAAEPAPGVWAGHERWDASSPTVPVVLAGRVTDDDPVSLLWSRVSGPGLVAFADPTALDTPVVFTSAGRHVLRLSAGDGTRTTTDDVRVHVGATRVVCEADAAVNSAAPTVNNGGFRWANVNDTNQAYFRFRFPAAIAGTVESAVARFAVAEGGYSLVARQLRRVADDSWDELTLTWNNRPTVDATVLGSFVPVNGWNEVELRGAVAAEVAGDRVLSLNVRAASTPSQWSLLNTKDCEPARLGCHHTPPEIVVYQQPSASALVVVFHPDRAREADGTVRDAGMVVAIPPPASALSVSLGSSLAARLVVPSTVVIPAGNAAAHFDVTTVDNADLDGDAAVDVSAAVSDGSYTVASAVFHVLDDDAEPGDGGAEDVGPDVPPDADIPADVGPDVGPDVPPDADVPADVGPDVGPDTAVDAAVDVGPEVAPDADGALADSASDAPPDGDGNGGCGCRAYGPGGSPWLLLLLSGRLLLRSRRRSR